MPPALLVVATQLLGLIIQPHLKTLTDKSLHLDLYLSPSAVVWFDNSTSSDLSSRNSCLFPDKILTLAVDLEIMRHSSKIVLNPSRSNLFRALDIAYREGFVPSSCNFLIFFFLIFIPDADF